VSSSCQRVNRPEARFSMAETLDRIRYRLSMDALAGFLNGPRALSFQAGKTIVTMVSRHPPGGMPRFAQVTDLEPYIAG